MLTGIIFSVDSPHSASGRQCWDGDLVTFRLKIFWNVGSTCWSSYDLVDLASQHLKDEIPLKVVWCIPNSSKN